LTGGPALLEVFVAHLPCQTLGAATGDGVIAPIAPVNAMGLTETLTYGQTRGSQVPQKFAAPTGRLFKRPVKFVHRTPGIKDDHRRALVRDTCRVISELAATEKAPTPDPVDPREALEASGPED